ncbi:MAG: hypothetical protein KDK39_00995 [Leptospiraceae bacterium]|nr:hypothetical protein [Leptospiraceae bacterium]
MKTKHCSAAILLHLSLLGVLANCDAYAPADASDTAVEAEANHPAAESSAIKAIRTAYTDAMQIKADTIAWQCPDDPVGGQVHTRSQTGRLVWIEYSSGGEHGAVTWQALLQSNAVLFIMVAESSWTFDPGGARNPDGGEATLDTAEQSRFYFQNGHLIQALYKKASASSAKGELLDQRLAQTANQKLSDPAQPAAAAREVIRQVLQAYRGKEITKDWCGLNN